MAILRGFQLPDGILLLYPATATNSNHFFPSNLLALDDQLLNFALLRYVTLAFLRKGGDPTNNSLLSPIYAPEEILAKFPPTKLILAEIDPLRDAGLYFAYKLKKAGVDT